MLLYDTVFGMITSIGDYFINMRKTVKFEEFMVIVTWK
jgi:hypothetical protein